jgi:hypothetical protein
MARRDDAHVRPDHHIVCDVETAKVIECAVLIDEDIAPDAEAEWTESTVLRPSLAATSPACSGRQYSPGRFQSTTLTFGNLPRNACGIGTTFFIS